MSGHMVMTGAAVAVALVEYIDRLRATEGGK